MVINATNINGQIFFLAPQNEKTLRAIVKRFVVPEIDFSKTTEVIVEKVRGIVRSMNRGFGVITCARPLFLRIKKAARAFGLKFDTRCQGLGYKRHRHQVFRPTVRHGQGRMAARTQFRNIGHR